MNELTENHKEENVEIFDLVVRSGSLPVAMDQLVPLSFIGSAAVSFYRAKVKMMDQLGMTEEQRRATLSDGQDAGKMLLDIEARIGELLPSVKDMTTREVRERSGKGERSLPDEMTSRRAHSARQIKSNPAAVAAVIKEAEENEDIPTKTAVLNRIRADRAEVAATRAKAAAAQAIEKQVDKEVKQRPKIVVDYFDAIKNYRDVLKLAGESAKRGMFAEESINIVITKHNELRALMNELEKSI